MYCYLLDLIIIFYNIQELVEERDHLEKQLSQLTALLGQVEEKRLSTIKDMENMKVIHQYMYTYVH